MAPPLERHGAHASHIGEALRVEGLGVRFGEVEALHDVSFSAGHGELIGVIGPTGQASRHCSVPICGPSPTPAPSASTGSSATIASIASAPR